MSSNNINLTLKIWRQESSSAKGNFEEFKISVSPDASILEMLDELNNRLEKEGKIPVAFESDCREGICGTCGLVVNGRPHGHLPKTATCQLHMRNRPQRSVSVKDVVKAVADFYNIEEDSIYQKTRRKEVVKPRQVVMFLLIRVVLQMLTQSLFQKI